MLRSNSPTTSTSVSPPATMAVRDSWLRTLVRFEPVGKADGAANENPITIASSTTTVPYLPTKDRLSSRRSRRGSLAAGVGIVVIVRLRLLGARSTHGEWLPR